MVEEAAVRQASLVRRRPAAASTVMEVPGDLKTAGVPEATVIPTETVGVLA